MSHNTKECFRGHTFEPDYPESDDCPYCAKMERGIRPTKTVPFYPDGSPGTASAASSASTASPTKPLSRSKTVADYGDVQDPVAGWLVATVGPLRGQDFRVPLGRSSFGRDPSCRICIVGDPSVSSHQGYINYSRNRRFMVSPGEGSSLLYVNGAEVLSPIELHAYDVIEIGKTTMAFIPFCGEQFDWAGEPK